MVGNQNPTRIYLFKANNGNTRALCEINWNSAINALERRHRRSIANSIIALLSLLNGFEKCSAIRASVGDLLAFAALECVAWVAC